MPVIVPPAGDLGPAPGSKESPPPPETTLGLELDGGLSFRLGDSADYGFEKREGTGLTFGVGAWFAPTRLWSIGLAYQRAALGSDGTPPGTGSMTVQRSLDALWLGGRAYPWRTDSVGIFLGLRLGMSWQHVSADGTQETSGFVEPSSSYKCSGGDGPGFALGGGLGLDVDLDRGLAFITQLDASGHRHTSDPVDDCAPGSGSVTSVSAQIGFAYRFDLDPNAKPASANQTLLGPPRF